MLNSPQKVRYIFESTRSECQLSSLHSHVDTQHKKRIGKYAETYLNPN